MQTQPPGADLDQPGSGPCPLCELELARAMRDICDLVTQDRERRATAAIMSAGVARELSEMPPSPEGGQQRHPEIDRDVTDAYICEWRQIVLTARDNLIAVRVREPLWSLTGRPCAHCSPVRSSEV